MPDNVTPIDELRIKRAHGLAHEVRESIAHFLDNKYLVEASTSEMEAIAAGIAMVLSILLQTMVFRGDMELEIAHGLLDATKGDIAKGAEGPKGEDDVTER